MNEDKISDLNKTARESIDRVMNRLGTKPIVDVNDVAEWTGYTTRGAYKVVERMVELGILTENGDKSYGQTWISAEHLVEQQASRGVTSPDTINIVSVSYDANGSSTKTNDLGMREMQKRAYDKRDSQHLLIKAPPASGKSRALMYIALDKLANQGRKKVIIAVPERAIGASFADEDLTSGGFFTDWHIDDRNNLTNEDGDTDKSKVGAFMRFMDSDDPILLCTHATLRFAFEQITVEKFNDTVLAIDEFHHASTSETSRLGELLHHVMRGSNVQIVAMTGSYFRGDTVPILTAEDEEKFDKVTYTYYEQLSGYSYLKTLGIGYHFYTGKYYDEGALDAVLDNKRKTIVHIPNVNSRESTKVGKHEEVQRVYDVLGTWLRKDEVTGLDIIETSDGRQLKVANLVEDESNHRSKLSKYLFSHARKEIDAVDIIVALGMAKEGFDWPYCEHALTIGYRSSLTEIVQIIGRCTRDSYNKSHAQFTNLIAQPSGTTDDVVVSVNNMLKAITVSLLMEQVLAPSFTFTPRPRDPRKAQPGEVFIKGLKQPTTEKVRRILETDLEDLTATLLQNDQVQKLAAKGVTGDVMKQIQSKIIREQHPDLNDEEIEATRQYLAANVAFKTATIIKGEDGSDKFIKLANRFVKIDELDMNLIDSVNPFHHAFEVISKKVGADAFKIIQDTILGSRINMTEEEALAFVPQLRAFNVAHMGKMPSLSSNDPNEKHLAQVYAFIMALGAREREARYAALRLIGATKKQIRNIAFVDSLAASLAGVLAGATLYLLIRPILFNARMDGRRFFPEDISVSPLMFGAIVIAIVAIVWLANKIAMRKVITSPLGVARKQKLAKAPRVWSVVPLLLCLAGFIYLGSLDKDTAYEQFGTAFSLYILGLFMLTMLSLLLAGGWLTKLYGKLISLVDKRAGGMLVSRRISYEARKIFRGIGGIVIAFFAGAFFIATFATIANFADGSTSTVIKAIPDNSIFSTDLEGSASLVNLQKTIDQSGSYQNEPVKIYMSGVNTSVISCPDAVRLFHKNCIGTAKYLEMPSLSTDDTVDMTRLTDVIPTVANGTTFVEHIYLPKPGQNVDLVNAEKVVTANASQGNTAGVTVVNSTLRAVAINGILGSFKDLLYAGIVLTVIVASLNLIVATVAGLFDRKGSFFTLRLSGAEMPFLKKIVTRESMLPLVFISLVSIALGFYAAYVFLRLASTKLRYAFVLPEPFFWVCVVAVFVLSYLGIRLILPMLGKLTDIESNRTE